MFLQSNLAMFGISLMVRMGSTERTTWTPPHPTRNPNFLGSKPTKAFYFPWMVSVHLETGTSRELFGSGSILTTFWVISSMDSFVRVRIEGRKSVDEDDDDDDDDDRPYFQFVANLTLYSGGVWGNGPRLQAPDDPFRPVWFQKRRVKQIVMFSDPDTKTARVEKFGHFVEPKNINDLKRSPFGFSMSICLVQVDHELGFNQVPWEWKRTTLPIPLFDVRSSPIGIHLETEVENMEKSPFDRYCYVAGWRLYDSRLVAHKVAYVTFDECAQIYCGFDKTACGNWPVNGTHVCFRSVTYDDLCWVDQGSALYCRSVSDSVIAILTSAPTCGHGGLPGVYTLVNYALELYEKVEKTERYDPISKDEEFQYTAPPLEKLIPVYR